MKLTKWQMLLHDLQFIEEYDNIISKYKLEQLSSEEINQTFWEENINNMKNNDFFCKKIFQTESGDYIFEVQNTNWNYNCGNWLVLSNAQKEVFWFDKQNNIIFIIWNLTSKRILGLEKKYNLKT